MHIVPCIHTTAKLGLDAAFVSSLLTLYHCTKAPPFRQ